MADSINSFVLSGQVMVIAWFCVWLQSAASNFQKYKKLSFNNYVISIVLSNSWKRGFQDCFRWSSLTWLGLVVVFHCFLCKPALSSCLLDSHSPLFLNLSTLSRQTKTLLISLTFFGRPLCVVLYLHSRVSLNQISIILVFNVKWQFIASVCLSVRPSVH